MSEKEEILYEDKYCKLTKEKLVIKTYFFPIGSKTIEVSSIKHVFYKKQKLTDDFFRVKGWGMTISPIWWACDIGRGLHGSSYRNVVIDCGSMTMKGFSVKNVDDFLHHMRQLLDPSVFHPDMIPTFDTSEKLTEATECPTLDITEKLTEGIECITSDPTEKLTERTECNFDALTDVK